MPGGLVGRSQAATEADIAAGTLGGRGEHLVRVGVRRVSMASMVDGERGATYHKKENGNPTSPTSVNQD